MTTVIEQLEQEDNSPKAKVDLLLAFLQKLHSWFHPIDREVCNARSTHFSEQPSFNQYPPQSFVVEIKTTKSAISDKRFEVLLDTPPEGYAVMGKQKSRKDALITYQYVRVDQMALSEKECVGLARQEHLTSLVQDIENNLKSLQESFQQNLVGKVNSREAQIMLNNRLTHEYYTSIKDTFNNILSHWERFEEDKYLTTRLLNMLISNSMDHYTECKGNVRYSLRLQHLVSNIISEDQWNWREGDDFPRSVIWRLKQLT